MKTINKILRYNFSQEKIQELIREWIVNGCWGKGWFNFSDFFSDILKYFPSFQIWKNFIEDLFLLCVEHDYDYYNQIWFHLANFYFARWIFQLLNWTSLPVRIFTFIIILYFLTTKWKKYYKNKNPN